MSPFAVPLRRQGPITGAIVLPGASLKTATADDGPLPSQGHVGYLERVQ